jgi:Tfp pilus assembly protein PilZ
MDPDLGRLSARAAAQSGANHPQRQTRRVLVPGAVVSYETHSFLRRASTPPGINCEIADLSKGGIAFLTDNALKPNSKISMVVNIPEDLSMRLKGRVVYCIPRGAGLSSRYRVGVKFNEFGVGSACNTPSLFELVDRFEKADSVEDP